MTIIINRVETNKDTKGRIVTTQTMVLYANLKYEANMTANAILSDIIYEADEDGTLSYNVSSDIGQEVELTGNHVLNFLEQMRLKNCDISNLWEEDGISSVTNDEFNISKQLYNVEITC